jgi:hypothetical protein
VREGETDRSDGPVPSNRPVSSILDQLCGFDGSERDLKVSKLLDLEIVIAGGKLSTEDGIETDRSPGDDILPFGVRELRTVWFVNE